MGYREMRRSRYRPPEHWVLSSKSTYECDHPLYSKCTLYWDGEIGLAVVQERFNTKTKTSWIGPIDPWLVDDIKQQSGWKTYFKENAAKGVNGLYPTVTIRKLMRDLGMKSMPSSTYEEARMEYLTLGKVPTLKGE